MGGQDGHTPSLSRPRFCHRMILISNVPGALTHSLMGGLDLSSAPFATYAQGEEPTVLEGDL